MKNTTSAALTGALVTAAIGGLAYVGKQIYDKYHYHETVFGDDESDWESDPYCEDDDDDFFEEDDETDDSVDTEEKTASDENAERPDISVSECVEYDRDAFLPEE